MNTRRRLLTVGLQAGLTLAAAGRLPNAAAQTPPSDALPMQRLQKWLTTPRLMGQQRFTFWGFSVYDASLWANATFSASDWDRQALVLDLRYLRDFKGADIAQRSMDEMQGQRALTPAQTQNWSTLLNQLIPNVRAGERLTGVYVPQKGLQLLHQEQLLGEMRDAELAQRFMGIWLAPETSQRQLRQQLLAGAQP
ncbi:chalcone isomerase family protein [Limnohabitans sp. B9-3]|uniref:chalcone isomerase family protein n=1 Tax=Limnohabitans sp. B9-3 TaxID=1100707 RepID=UPI000C1EAD62|nr:chalcone isomerase family protein [Limnohabitans sp. B9-3]PIT71621.1 hypothetical protein B9Z42_14200 [Limnohabitans sp. B9-3]